MANDALIFIGVGVTILILGYWGIAWSEKSDKKREGFKLPDTWSDQNWPS
jgi:hypothetical protein